MDTGRVGDQADSRTYDHARWEGSRRFLRFLLRTVGRLLLRVDAVDGLEHFPREGPAVLMMNHIAFVDPIVLVHIAPRQIVPLGKIEAFHYPLLGIIPRLWGAIPVRRGDVDLNTLRKVFAVLDAGEVVLVAPEGTRSPQLGRGLEGVAYIAGRSGVPVVPVAMDGTEGYPSLPVLPRWWRGGARVRFGRPFRYRSAFRRPRRGHLRQMTEEAMFILAGMLPEQRRGVYANLDKATQETIEWL